MANRIGHLFNLLPPPNPDRTGQTRQTFLRDVALFTGGTFLGAASTAPITIDVMEKQKAVAAEIRELETKNKEYHDALQLYINETVSLLRELPLLPVKLSEQDQSRARHISIDLESVRDFGDRVGKAAIATQFIVEVLTRDNNIVFSPLPEQETALRRIENYPNLLRKVSKDYCYLEDSFKRFNEHHPSENPQSPTYDGPRFNNIRRNVEYEYEKLMLVSLRTAKKSTVSIKN